MLCYRRARRRSPRKTPMRARFPRRTLDSDWTARCHTRRRTSCLSCFRSHTYCNASLYSKPQVTGSPCSTPPYGSAGGCVKGEPVSGFDSVYARNGRRVMWSPLRQRRTPAWHPLSGCPVTQSPCYPAGWIGAKTGGYPLTGNLSNSLEQPLVSVPSGSAPAGRHNSARPQQHRRVASSPSGRGLHSLAQVSTVKSPAHIAPRPPAGESRCQVSERCRTGG